MEEVFGELLKQIRGRATYSRLEKATGIPKEKLKRFERGGLVPTKPEFNSLKEGL